MNLPAIQITSPESSKQSDERFTQATRQNIGEIGHSSKAPKKGHAEDIYMLVIYELISTANTVTDAIAIKGKGIQEEVKNASSLEHKLDQLEAKPLPKPPKGKSISKTALVYYQNEDATITKERSVLSAEVTLDQNINMGRQGEIQVKSSNVCNIFHETSVLIGMVQHINFNANLTKRPQQ